MSTSTLLFLHILVFVGLGTQDICSLPLNKNSFFFIFFFSLFFFCIFVGLGTQDICSLVLDEYSFLHFTSFASNCALLAVLWVTWPEVGS